MKSKPLVIFILGGPGSGKGTQCNMIKQHFKFIHLSAGDLLRQQRQNPQSKDGQLIESCIVEGKIVPSEITVKLLQKAMRKQGWSNRFLIDGFPRNKQNLQNWNIEMHHQIQHPFIVNMRCSQQVLRKRLLKRGQTSGRSDDNQKTILKRFETYNKETMQVVDYYRGREMLVEVDADNSVEGIFKEMVGKFKAFGVE